MTGNEVRPFISRPVRQAPTAEAVIAEQNAAVLAAVDQLEPGRVGVPLKDIAEPAGLDHATAWEVIDRLARRGELSVTWQPGRASGRFRLP